MKTDGLEPAEGNGKWIKPICIWCNALSCSSFIYEHINHLCLLISFWINHIQTSKWQTTRSSIWIRCLNWIWQTWHKNIFSSINRMQKCFPPNEKNKTTDRQIIVHLFVGHQSFFTAIHHFWSLRSVFLDNHCKQELNFDSWNIAAFKKKYFFFKELLCIFSAPFFWFYFRILRKMANLIAMITVKLQKYWMPQLSQQTLAKVWNIWKT